MATYPDFTAHANEDRDTSGEILTAIEGKLRQALPAEWSGGVTWAHTGGGCSGWEILARDENGKVDETRGGFLLTGSADETEASGDLSRGVMVGFYGTSPFDGDDHYETFDTGTPAEIADAVLAYVAATIKRADAVRELITPAVETALEAFWQSIADSFRPFTSEGGMDDTLRLESAARDALETWVMHNVSTKPEV